MYRRGALNTRKYRRGVLTKRKYVEEGNSQCRMGALNIRKYRRERSE